MSMIGIIDTMKHSPIRNYAGVPGLTSWLIGDGFERGKVRLFECERQHQEVVIPHSHRFNFSCQVLEGSVTNRVWTESKGDCGDLFCVSRLRYGEEPGKYDSKTTDRIAYFSFDDSIYEKGDSYSMSFNEVHSIYFSRGARVLFFEGPLESKESFILEPVVNGITVPTFKVEPWMFQRHY